MCNLKFRLVTAVSILCFTPALAMAEPWDISLKMEAASWSGTQANQQVTVSPPNQSFVITKPLSATTSKESQTQSASFWLNADLETFMRYHFNAANPALASGLTVEQQSAPSAQSPSILSSFVDSETSQRNTKLIGTALNMAGWTIGAGYVWQQHMFTSSSQDKTEGFVMGLAYQGNQWQTNVSYVSSRQSSNNLQADKRQYDSVLASYSWKANDQWSYTAALQYRDIKKQYRAEKDSYRITFGATYRF